MSAFTLDNFTTGFFDAMCLANPAIFGSHTERSGRLEMLSPSALERIVRDCGERCRLAPQWARAGASHDGCRFWEMRQRETMRMTFPPLTVSLDDAGKVTLAERVAA